MNRAYSLLEIKSIDEESRTFEGIASTPALDHGNDSMDPMGAQFSLPMPLMWQHGKADIKDPIGWITDAIPGQEGIPVKGRFAKVDEPKSLKDDLDRAWALVKAKLVRGLSIGWTPVDGAPMKGGGYRWSKWGWHETSAVAIPMNAEASITMIKSIDSQLRAASGTGVVRLGPTPGATGKAEPASSRSFFDPSKGKDMTASEHIAALEAKRAANVARMKAIEDEASGATMDDEQGQEHDGLSAEIKTIDIDLKRRRASEALMCCMRAKGDTLQALENAKMYRDTPDVEQAVRVLMHAKSAVAAGNTTDSTWAAPLVVYQNLASAFIELLRPMTILGKLPGMASVPFNISIPRQTAGSVSQWVGEDDPKPVSRLSLETITLGHTKIATIVVLTEELVQDSDPSAEALVQRDMLASIRAYSDAQFIDPTVTASGAIRPASITNGLTVHNMTGTAVANVLTDVQTLMSGFITANIDFTGAVWVMHPRTALYLSMLLSPLGTFQFPGISVTGGTFMGFPVITSASVPIDTGADTYIVLLSAPDILMADKGLVIDVSREASLQMDSAPSDSAASMISLWQKNLVGLRAERRINYRRRREAAVQVLSAVSY